MDAQVTSFGPVLYRFRNRKISQGLCLVDMRRLHELHRIIVAEPSSGDLSAQMDATLKTHTEICSQRVRAAVKSGPSALAQMIPTGRRARTANSRCGRPLSVTAVGSRRNRAPSAVLPCARGKTSAAAQILPSTPRCPGRLSVVYSSVRPTASGASTHPAAGLLLPESGELASLVRAWVLAAAKQHRAPPSRVARASRWPPTASLPSPAGHSR